MRRSITRFGLAAASVLLIGLAGCGGGSDGGGLGLPETTTTPPPTVPTARASVEGQVVDGRTGAGIAGATVRSGTATATTSPDGRYTLAVEASERVVLNVQASGFAEGLTISSAAEALPGVAVTKLLPVSASATISSAAGGTVSVPDSPAAVVLPAGAFGSAGEVRVDVTVVQPALDPSLMPGDFLTETGQRIESAGALIVTPRDAAGNAVQLAAGQSATIRIPVSSRGALTPTIPLFYLKPDTGRWVQEGTATLAGTAPNQYYEGSVTHFSTWNSDRVYETIMVRGCVQNGTNARVANVSVTSDGIDYSGTASAPTDANGSFAVAMKKGAKAALTGVSAGRLTNSLSVGPSDTDITLQTCLTQSDTNNSVTMRLTWGATPEDVDSHLFTPSGFHVYYSNPGSLGSEPFASLDVDDVTSFGPEVITVTKLMVGTYTYGVHNFSGESAPGLTASPVRVELNVAGRSQVFTLPAGETASTGFVTLFKLAVDARCNVTVTAVNTWDANVPADPAPTTPTYCTP